MGEARTTKCTCDTNRAANFNAFTNLYEINLYEHDGGATGTKTAFQRVDIFNYC